MNYGKKINVAYSDFLTHITQSANPEMCISVFRN